MALARGWHERFRSTICTLDNHSVSCINFKDTLLLSIHTRTFDHRLRALRREGIGDAIDHHVPHALLQNMITHAFTCTVIRACQILRIRTVQNAKRLGYKPAPSQGKAHCTSGGVSFTGIIEDVGRGVHHPLVEQPAAASVPAQAIIEWYKEQQNALQSVGNDLSQTVDGPTATDLQAELDWLLDDSIADFDGSQQGSRGNTKWRQLKQQKSPGGAASAQLRLTFDSLAALWRRRIHNRVPLQYLTGSAHWRDLVLAVGPGVLIPRPETELLIDFAQEAMSNVPDGADGLWADLGTGSGALSIALTRCLSNKGRVYAVDASEEAAAWARLNVTRYNLHSRLQVLVGSWFEPLHAHQGQLSGVLCNPPYIASEVVPTLQAEVTRHEPWSALDGGKGTGSAMLLDICGAAVSMLQPGGFLALETGGDAQAEEVAAFMARLSDGNSGKPVYTGVTMRKDLRGVTRFVTAYRL